MLVGKNKSDCLKSSGLSNTKDRSFSKWNYHYCADSAFSFACSNKESLHATWFKEGYLVIFFPSAFREVVKWKSWPNYYHRVQNHRVLLAGRAIQRSLVHTLLREVRLTSKLDQTLLGLTEFWIYSGHASCDFSPPFVPDQNFPCFNTQLAERIVCLNLSYNPPLSSWIFQWDPP